MIYIGYGDYHPTDDAGRLFTCFYVVIGVGVCGSFIAMLRSLYEEHYEKKKAEKSLRELTIIEEVVRNNVNTTNTTYNKPKDTTFNPIQTETDENNNQMTNILRHASAKELLKNISSQAKKMKVIKNAFLDSYNRDITSQWISALLNVSAIFTLIFIGALSMSFVSNAIQSLM